MMTTPLIGCGDVHLAPQSLLWTLIYQTLWIPVPGRLETFAQGKVLATFVGMSLDLFQSRTLIQLRQKQQPPRTLGHVQPEAMDVDSAQLLGSRARHSDTVGSLEQLERDTAVEAFRVMLDQRLKDLEPITRDRPGFEGFAQGMKQYRERQQKRVRQN